MKMNKSFVTLALSAIGLLVPYSSDAAGAVPGSSTAQPNPIVPKVAAVSPVTRTGTVKVVVTLAIESAIGADEPITCSASISASDASFDNEATTSNVLVRSGSTGTATLTIPYDWTMAATGESAQVSLSCSEGSSFNTGGVSHSIYFTGSTFVVPVTAGTVTTLSKSASM